MEKSPIEIKPLRRANKQKIEEEKSEINGPIDFDPLKSQHNNMESSKDIHFRVMSPPKIN